MRGRGGVWLQAHVQTRTRKQAPTAGSKHKASTKQAAAAAKVEAVEQGEEAEVETQKHRHVRRGAERQQCTTQNIL